jgi:hypothetical protein
MAMTGFSTGVENKGKYDFKPGGPQDEEYYGVIAQGLKDSEAMEAMLKNSAVDVNIIVIPHAILKPLQQYLLGDVTGSPDLYFTGIDQSLLSRIFQSGQAYVKGQNKLLDSLRSQYQPDAFNIVVQRKDKDNEGAIFSVPWVIHDVIGHALNFASLGTELEAALDIFVAFGSLGKRSAKSFDAGKDFERQMGVGSISSEEINSELEKRLLDFFEEKDFTANPFAFDVGASIIAYYFIYRELPPPIQDAIYNGEIDAMTMEEYKLKMDKIFKTLIGKVSYVNFGPSSSAY